jgi:hypothetical protein
MVKVLHIKVVPNIQIYHHTKFHIFLGSPSISFQFISHLPRKSSYKREIKLKKLLGPFSSMSAQSYSTYRPSPCMIMVMTVSRTPVIAS